MKVIENYLQEGFFGPKTIPDEDFDELVAWKKHYWTAFTDIPPHKDINMLFTYTSKYGITPDQRKSGKTISKCKSQLPQIPKRIYDFIMAMEDDKELKKKFPFALVKNWFEFGMVSVSETPGDYIFYSHNGLTGNVVWFMCLFKNYKFEIAVPTDFGLTFPAEKILDDFSASSKKVKNLSSKSFSKKIPTGVAKSMFKPKKAIISKNWKEWK